MSSNVARVPSSVFAVALVCAGALTGCALADPDPSGMAEPVAEAADPLTLAEVHDLQRVQVTADVYRYSFLLKVGATPNAQVRIHRVVREIAPWLPRPSASAVMLLHGDFATFTTNFAPAVVGAERPPSGGLAVYLASAGVDVWGLDRRWTTAKVDATDISDFAGMTFSAELDDIERALAFARASRVVTGSGPGRMILAGFSRGGQLAYTYAGRESQLPPAKRHLRGLVPLDVYARISPTDEDLRQNACIASFYDHQALADGVIDSDNSMVIQIGALAVSAPSDPSPIFHGFTNHGLMLEFITKTYDLFAPTPVYHLGGGVLAEGTPTALRYSSEPVIDRWLKSAPFHQALAESADGDALWCGDAPLPFEDHLADISIPLYYLGAAGGFGDHGLYTTTLVASTDVTTHVIRRLPVEREAEDFGHADLLYGSDAPLLAWQPLAQWILEH
jgi:hypothetical protein